MKYNKSLTIVATCVFTVFVTMACLRYIYEKHVIPEQIHRTILYVEGKEIKNTEILTNHRTKVDELRNKIAIINKSKKINKNENH